jgi:hypothetical protein
MTDPPTLDLLSAMSALVLPGLEVGAPLWQVRKENDQAAVALANRHYPRQNRNGKHVASPGRKLVLVTPCERAVWVTHWPDADKTLDGLDCWRCAIFRNEGAGLSSDLIRVAMALTLQLWDDRPTTVPGWVTFVDRAKVESGNPGACFYHAGWWWERAWKPKHPKKGTDLIRLRAPLLPIP